MEKHWKIFICLLWSCFFYTQSNLIIKDNLSGKTLPNLIYFCGGESLSLQIDANASAETGSYDITSASTTPFIATEKVPFSLTRSNAFSKAIPLPFPFKFYGNTYDKVVVGANGRLVFSSDKTLVDNLHTDSYKDDYENNFNNHLPSLGFNKIPNPESIASIFAGWSFLQSGSTTSSANGRNIYYKSDSSKFIIEFRDINFQGSSGKKLSSQIILYPNHSFDIIIIEKGLKILSGDDRLISHSILGIQNEEATLAQWPANDSNGSDPDFYNNGKWEVKRENPTAYHFSPNTETLQAKITWLKNSTIIGNSQPFTLNTSEINDNDTLKAKIEYFRASDPSTIIKTENSTPIVFKKLPILHITTTNLCDISAKLEVDNLPYIKYQWYKDGASIPGAQSYNYHANENGTYHVEISSEFFPSCKSFSPSTNVSLHSVLPNFNSIDKKICNTSYNLENDFPKGDGTKYTVTYKDEDGNDISPNLLFSTSGTKKGTVEVKAIGSSCTPIAYDYNIEYLAFPENGKEYTSELLCHGTTSYDLSDFEQSLNQPLYQFSYSLDNGTTWQDLSEINPSQYPKIKVKITAPSFPCETIVNLKFNISEEIKLPLSDKEIQNYFPEHCYSNTEYFDLNQLKNELEVGGLKVDFYKDSPLSDPITNLNFRGSGLIYLKIYHSSTPSCYIVKTIELKIYPKPNFNLPTSKTIYSKCDSNIYDLKLSLSNLGIPAEWHAKTRILYFDASNTEISGSDISNYNSSRGTPRAYIIYNTTNNNYHECSDVINYQLTPAKKPVAKKTLFYYCSETSFNKEDIIHQLIDNSSDYDFTDQNRQPLANLFMINQTYKIIIKNKTTGCISDEVTIRFEQGSSTSFTIQPIKTCDNEGDVFDGKTSIDLTQVEQEIQMQHPGTYQYEYYKKDGTKINNPRQYLSTAFDDEIIINIIPSDETLCPSRATFNVVINTPTKALGLNPEYNLCYDEPLNIAISNASEYTSIQWKDAKGNIINNAELYLNYSDVSFGRYEVTFTALNGCSYTESFEVSKSKQPVISQVNTDNNRIEIIASGGEAPYLYSFDGGKTWQDSPILNTPNLPFYTLVVKSKNTGCLGEPKKIYFLKTTNVITPNGDGRNDTWEIHNLDKMENIELLISNRNGVTLFHSQSKNNLQWKGLHNGRPLPTGTYWYVVKWLDPTTQQSHQQTGWILLKNRN